jgi:hypothetical protein
MTTSPTLEALAIAVATRTPVLLWGAPGTGKTSAVESLAATLGAPCEVVIASIHEPTDFNGLPVVDDGDVHFAPPRWARRLAEDAADGALALLFLDELSTAPPSVQAALLRIVLERTVGDLVLGEHVAVIAAANPPEQAADGWDLSPPLANRFFHLAWTTSAAEFAEGFVGGWPSADLPNVPADWADRLPAVRAVIASFLRTKPTLLSAVPSDDSSGRAWPSPRTWDMASRLWAACEAATASGECRTALLAGAVGEGPAIEVLRFARDLDLPDPEAVLAAPGAFDVPDRADRAFALLSSVAGAVAANPTVERWSDAWEVVARVASGLPDVAAVAARVLAGCRPPGAVPPSGVKSLAGVLTDAGLLKA